MVSSTEEPLHSGNATPGLRTSVPQLGGKGVKWGSGSFRGSAAFPFPGLGYPRRLPNPVVAPPVAPIVDPLSWCSASQPVRRRLGELGIASALDLSGFFDSADDVRQFFRRDWPLGDQEEAVTAWQVACRSSRVQVRSLAAQDSARACVVCPNFATSPSSSSISPSLPSMGIASSSTSMGTIALPPKRLEPPAPKEVAREAGAKERILVELAGLYYAMASSGLHWEEVLPGDLHLQRHLLMQTPARLTAARLAAILRAWKHWEQWRSSRPWISRWSPSSVQLGLVPAACFSAGPDCRLCPSGSISLAEESHRYTFSSLCPVCTRFLTPSADACRRTGQSAQPGGVLEHHRHDFEEW